MFILFLPRLIEIELALVCLQNYQIVLEKVPVLEKKPTYITSIVSLWRSNLFQVIPMPAPIAKVINDDSIAYCAEEWGKYEKGRLIYSCFSILVQVSLNSKVQTIWFSSHFPACAPAHNSSTEISSSCKWPLGNAHCHMVLLLVERSTHWKVSRILKFLFPCARTLERNQTVMTESHITLY